MPFSFTVNYNKNGGYEQMNVVFYDTENLNLSKKNQSCKLREIHRSIPLLPDLEGAIEHRLYFTNTESGAKLKDAFPDLNNKFLLFHRPRKKKVRNFLDFYIFMDAVALAYTRPQIEHFIIVSKDSDFFILAQYLRGIGKKVSLFEQNSLVIQPFPTQAESTRKFVQEAARSSLHTQDFNLFVHHILQTCAESPKAQKVLQEGGINISLIYESIKQAVGQNKLSYKQNGEKKMHLSFARALLESNFCVIEKNSLFFVVQKDCIPAASTLVVLPEAVDPS